MDSLFDLPFEDEPDPAARSPVRRVYTVAELTAEIRSLLEQHLFEVWVEGELSNCRPYNGHLYFTLKDDRAQLKGFMFRSDLRFLKFKPEDGLHVIARGRVTVYEPRGEYQMTCTHLEPRGLGALQLAFDQLKRKLQAEGLFDHARKRPLPVLPRKIGIVTSLDGAAVRDIIKVLRRRYGNAHLVIRPARVQGDGAADDVARAIAALARVDGVDVLIVGRGGGSIEDLWAFNEEAVARAIVACPVPVVSAVGHEGDVTIADFVADVRAATPSNAAEIVVARKDEFAGRIARIGERLRAAARGRVHRQRRALHLLAARPGLAGFGARFAGRARHLVDVSHGLAHAARGLLADRRRELRDWNVRLEARDQRRRLAAGAGRLAGLDARLRASVAARRHRARHRLRELAGCLEAMSPLAVLGRGYAVCWTDDRRTIVREAFSSLVGAQVRVTLSRGELRCTVIGVEPPPLNRPERE